jgi:hypothetical protein
MASSARAIRAAWSPLGAVAGRFVAALAGLRRAVRELGFDTVFLAFLDICEVPDPAAISAL